MNWAGYCWRCEAPCAQHCSRCGVAFYCSKRCQKQDKWRHQPNCNAAALKKQCMGCGRTDGGMLRCSTCLRSWYCDRDCQRKNWESHKEQCHDVVIKTIQVAKTIKMKRINARLFPGMVYTYYWGNMPAVDLLNLPMNEGEEYSNSLALLLCGVGDPRNVLLTIASLPDVYTQQVSFVLNDICPCTLARTVLLLYMLYKGGSEVVCTVIRIWYSLRLSENDFSLLVSTLEDLLAAGDVGSLTSGFMNAGTPEQLKELKSVWNTWANLSTLEGHWVTDRRKAALQKDEGTAESAQNYLNSIPQNHRDSAKMWIEDGLFATSQCNPSSLTKENITLTGSSFACKNFKTSEYDYCIPAKDVPFTGWDYKAIIDIEDSLPEMYNTYLSHILNKCIDKLRSCQVKLTLILSDCMAIDPFLPVELKYDRITTSNLSDYISLTTLLTKFKEYLNTKNSHSVLVTEVQNWSRYLPDVKNEMFQKYFELASKVLNDTNNPCLTLTNYSSLVEYHNLIPHFELYLRASLIESQSEEELDSLLRKKKVASIKAITTGLGLKLSDFVRNENTVFPARWAVNCRRVTKISGDEFALEWKLPPLP